MTIQLGTFRISIGRVKAPPRPVAPHRRGMNIAYWRTQPNLIAEAQKQWRTGFMQAVFSVLYSSMPTGYSTTPDHQLGRMNGWLECIRHLEALADSPPAPFEEPESTFGVSDSEETKQQ